MSIIKRVADIEGVMNILMTLVCTVMLAINQTYPKMSSEFPRMVIGITFLLCLYLLVGRLTGRIAPSKVKGAGKLGPSWWLFSLGLFLYFAAIMVVGFLPATLLYVVLSSLSISGRPKKWRTALIYGLAITIVFYAAMTYVMRIPIPPGMLPFFK